MKSDFEHALALLADANAEKAWSGPVAIVAVDPECRFDRGNGPCGRPLDNVCLLKTNDGKSVHVIGLCHQHTSVMQRAIHRWRRMS